MSSAKEWREVKATAALRDRIAAAIKQVDDMRVCKLSNADINFMADAVIAELGLRLDSTCHIHDREGKRRCHRYVTHWAPNGPDWKADDE